MKKTIMQEDILAALKKDPQYAMELLVEQYTGLLCSTASSYLSNPEDVKECVNDTFVEFYCNQDRFDENKGSLSAFLGTIVRNRAVSLYRKNRAYASQTLSEKTVCDADEISQSEARLDMASLLAALQPADAELIRLKYYSGMTIQEIANSLEISYESAKKRHQRILSRMRMLLMMSICLALGLLTACGQLILHCFGVIPGYDVREIREIEERAVYLLSEEQLLHGQGVQYLL